MKRFNKLFFAVLLLAFAFTACEKADKLPFYGEGTAATLSASATTIAPPPADSNKVALTLNWTDPKYAQSPSLYKFIIQMDSTTRGFGSKAASFEVTGALTKDLIAKELNGILLGWGFEFNKAYDVDVRVISSYGNNNEQKTSNTVKIRMTPYKIPPKVVLPTTGELYMVGDASLGGWNNPLAAQYSIAQKFARIDETTFGGVFQLVGGKEYLVLPVNNGNWDNKYSIANKSLAGIDVAGNFGYNLPDNFKSPAADGLYKITLDFQQGKYTVAAFSQQHGLPSGLWVAGDAFTPGIPAWTNTNPMPTGSAFTRRNATEFDLTVAMKGGGEYLLLPFGNGNWSKYAIANKTAAGAAASGNFIPEAADNLPGPAAAGNYKISINFFNNSYKVVQQ
jgi:starch-binding outer membrane protein SusE/F